MATDACHYLEWVAKWLQTCFEGFGGVSGKTSGWSHPHRLWSSLTPTKSLWFRCRPTTILRAVGGGTQISQFLKNFKIGVGQKSLWESLWFSAPEPQRLWSSLTSTFSLGVWSKYVLQLDKISLWFGCRTTTIPLLIITPTPHQRRFHYANTPAHDDSITPTPPPTPIPLRRQHPHPRRFHYANFHFVILLRWISTSNLWFLWKWISTSNLWFPLRWIYL